MSIVYIGLHQLIALSVSPAISRLRPGLYFRFALPFRLVEEIDQNLISLVSLLSTPTRGPRCPCRPLLPREVREEGTCEGSFTSIRDVRLLAANVARRSVRRLFQERSLLARIPSVPGSNGECALRGRHRLFVVCSAESNWRFRVNSRRLRPPQPSFMNASAHGHVLRSRRLDGHRFEAGRGRLAHLVNAYLDEMSKAVIGLVGECAEETSGTA